MRQAEPEGVTAVVAHYGDPGRTLALIGDLRQQVTQRRLEIVVSDDCSPVMFDCPLDGVTVIRRRVNGGYGAAVNSGVEAATQPLLLLLNNDLRLGPDFVEQICATAAPLQPCVAGPATVEGGAFLVTGRRFPTLWGQVAEVAAPLAPWRSTKWFQELIGRDLRCKPGEFVSDVDWLQGSALLLPAEVFRQVGGFDERFFMFSEEVDLQRRLADRGVRGAFLGQIQVIHEGGGSVSSERAAEWLQRSRYTYAAKWGSERNLRGAFRVVALANLLWNVALRMTGRRTAPRHAWRRQRHLAHLPVWPPAPSAHR